MRSYHWLDQFRIISVKNSSGEACPAYGLLAITGSELRGGRQILLGAKPSTTFYRVYVVNGPTEIPAGAVGEAYFAAGPQWIKYDTGTPSQRRRLGAEAWSMDRFQRLSWDHLRRNQRRCPVSDARHAGGDWHAAVQGDGELDDRNSHDETTRSLPANRGAKRIPDSRPCR
jgi:hypothetical protein